MSEWDTPTPPPSETQSTTPNNPPGWERDVLEKVLLAGVEEQRRARRWGIFFKLALLAYLGIALALAFKPLHEASMADGQEHTAVIDIAGLIMEGADTNADDIIDGLESALDSHHTKGIILRMNSPGGSPVQSAYIYDAVRGFKQKHPDLPIHAVVEDICASGCYYIAAAADKIYVNPSSIIGSIGVIMNGFGFVDTMEKLGVERRTLTAGAHKAILDPFSPVKPEEQAHIQGLIDNVHQLFITAVKQGRGERLHETPDMFSGLVWTGEKGITLGLADGVGTTRSVAKDVIGAEKLVNYTPQDSWMDRLAQRMGASAGQSFHSLVMGWGLR